MGHKPSPTGEIQKLSLSLSFTLVHFLSSSQILPHSAVAAHGKRPQTSIPGARSVHAAATFRTTQQHGEPTVHKPLPISSCPLNRHSHSDHLLAHQAGRNRGVEDGGRYTEAAARRRRRRSVVEHSGGDSNGSYSGITIILDTRFPDSTCWLAAAARTHTAQGHEAHGGTRRRKSLGRQLTQMARPVADRTRTQGGTAMQSGRRQHNRSVDGGDSSQRQQWWQGVSKPGRTSRSFVRDTGLRLGNWHLVVQSRRDHVAAEGWSPPPPHP